LRQVSAVTAAGYHTAICVSGALEAEVSEIGIPVSFRVTGLAPGEPPSLILGKDG